MITPQEMAFVERQITRLVEAEEKLNEMSEAYGHAKGRFDARMERQGIHADAGPEGMIAYTQAKELDPSLGYWYSKVEHFHAEIAARGALVSALADVAWLRTELAEVDDIPVVPVAIVEDRRTELRAVA